MTFSDLHEQLRQEIVRRISAGAITGTSLARQAGFQQAHISNFLNRRRSLSLEGLDRVMQAQGLTVDQLMPVDLAAAGEGRSGEAMETIPVVSASTAMLEAFVRPELTIETIQVSAARLEENRSRPAPKYAHWQRFVAVRADRQQAAAMEPAIGPGAIVVLDRHYNSLAPYRANHRPMYGVRYGSALMLRYVELDGRKLILRPLSMEFAVQLVALGPHESPGDSIVGRVCLALSEV